MSKYRRGADFERAVVKHLERQGYLSFRCAGSKGASKVDIVALCPYDLSLQVPVNYTLITRSTLLVQCKLSGIVSKFERKQLKEAAEKFGCLPILASKEDGKIKFEVI